MLKPFQELTQDELVALSREDIQFYIDYACAEAGVKLLPPQAPIEPKLEKPEHDLVVYDVGGIVVLARDAADIIAEAINKHQDRLITLLYMSGPSFEKKATPRTDPVVVTPIKVYSEHRAAMIGPALAEFDRAKKAYQEARKEYDDVLRARADIAAEINTAVEDAHARNWKQRDRREMFARYLLLANGNTTIAARFLYRSYPDALELVPDVFEGVALEPAASTGPVLVASGTDDGPSF